MAAQLDPQKLMEQLDQLPAPARFGVYGGVALLVVVLYYFTLYSSSSGKLQIAQTKLAKLQGEIAEAKAVAVNLEKFRASGDALKEEFRKALERLPNATELPVLLTDISSLGKKSGLEFRAFKPGKEVEREFFAEVPIDVEFVGKYHEAGVFLDRLSKLPRIVNVTTLSMKVEDDREPNPDLTVTGVATTFRFIEPKTPPPGADKGKGRARPAAKGKGA
jgi:type IV pilus assembly protein PilO